MVTKGTAGHPAGHKNGSQTVRLLAVVKLTRERAGELVKLAEELEE